MKVIINGKEVEVTDFTNMEHIVISDSVTKIGGGFSVVTAIPLKVS